MNIKYYYPIILLSSLLVWDLLLFLVSAFAMLTLILAVDQHSTFTTYHAWAALLLIMVQRNANTNSNMFQRKKGHWLMKLRCFLEFVGLRSPTSLASSQTILPQGWYLSSLFPLPSLPRPSISVFHWSQLPTTLPPPPPPPSLLSSSRILKVCVPHHREHLGGMHCTHCGVHVEVLPWLFMSIDLFLGSF